MTILFLKPTGSNGDTCCSRFRALIWHRNEITSIRCNLWTNKLHRAGMASFHSIGLLLEAAATSFISLPQFLPGIKKPWLFYILVYMASDFTHPFFLYPVDASFGAKCQTTLKDHQLMQCCVWKSNRPFLLQSHTSHREKSKTVLFSWKRGRFCAYKWLVNITLFH